MSDHFPFTRSVPPGSLGTADAQTFAASIVRPQPLTHAAELTLGETRSPGRVLSSRRRKLWEVEHKYHCPIIGVCLAVDELRRLTVKILKYDGDSSDYGVHTLAVSACDTRNQLSECINRTLDQRFAVSIGRFLALKTTAELKSAWQEACRQGREIPAALWAACTHPACDETLALEIYRDIHMIQHQVGSGTRCDLQAMKHLRDENAQLQRLLDGLREKHESLQQVQARRVQSSLREMADVQSELAQRELLVKRLQAEVCTLRSEIPELAERQQLQQRAQAAEERIRIMIEKEKESERELVRLRDFAHYAEETIEALSADESSSTDLVARQQEATNDQNFLGKCVLCVGGRPGSVNSYREVVEQCGGRFMHHDGGLEESKHRIDAALSAADIVICQAGCISHNAYWRVKEQCKRTGKLCMFVKSSGLSSFGKVLDEARKKTAAP
jgi:hypothetical protein